jgi:thiamine-phosphate pyrophosphorylase
LVASISLQISFRSDRQDTVSHPPQTTYRILDASANRASEGIRTIEEFVRFGLDDSAASRAAKEIRHDLAAALARLRRSELLSARDTDSDVGTAVETKAEYERADLDSVVTAAAERVQQSLRVLEEYGKTVDVEFARQIELLRYRAYTLHRDVELKSFRAARTRRLADAALYFLIGCKTGEDDFVGAIRALSEAGVNVFQLRDKQASDRLLYERSKIGTSIAAQCGVLFIVNDRADIARAAGADGVHVGQEELSPTTVREIVGHDRIVGVSTHNIAQVHQAIADGADYIGCGPTFPSTTKRFNSQAGTQFLKEVHAGTKETPCPAFAIGGIDQDNVAEVVACGFHRIAVTAAIDQADDPCHAARELRRRLGN